MFVSIEYTTCAARLLAWLSPAKPSSNLSPNHMCSSRVCWRCNEATDFIVVPFCGLPGFSLKATSWSLGKGEIHLKNCCKEMDMELPPILQQHAGALKKVRYTCVHTSVWFAMPPSPLRRSIRQVQTSTPLFRTTRRSSTPIRPMETP